ncbi:unnamed protein product [Didymodactylos carnosus]|uniref:F-box domain-containing protein n=1 Tax=Didymodactylos carnosus TaxID=1234261 RepID=A0A814MED3_9BILA|nr:unnamed protein product [Didymodactylos carnosus]CAF1078071.1 unnamed protein product [Didymodactylos carnosus]CAF3790208.1 unnamed protein product [Didymodactylos carnosus]CAF3844313.1 unnamed protein product [Didymodactylos carnosus]
MIRQGKHHRLIMMWIKLPIENGSGCDTTNLNEATTEQKPVSEDSQLFGCMDSGAFLDVIPNVLTFLDVKGLVQLAQTCRFWRHRVYSDLRLWTVVELPYVGRMESGDYLRYHPTEVIEAGLWSMVLPPEDPNALETVLSQMSSSDESIGRFQQTQKVDEEVTVSEF